MKNLLFLFLPLFAFAQQTKLCGLTESEVMLTSRTMTAEPTTEVKKTKLGFVYKTADLTLLYVKVNNTYNLNTAKGNSEAVKRVWATFFSPGDADIIQANGSDIRLQKYQDQFYIQLYSCPN